MCACDAASDRENIRRVTGEPTGPVQRLNIHPVGRCRRRPASRAG